MQGGAFRHQCRRDQLAGSPLAVGKHEYAQPRHVSARKEEMIGVITPPLRRVAQHVLAGRVKIFHAERTRQVIRERLEHHPSSELFVNRAGCTKSVAVRSNLGRFQPHQDSAMLPSPTLRLRSIGGTARRLRRIQNKRSAAGSCDSKDIAAGDVEHDGGIEVYHRDDAALLEGCR
jgi:hypothetical protein